MANGQWSVGERGTVTEVIRQAAARWPASPFVDFSGTVFTYAQVDEISTRFANSLRQLGLKAGETLVTILDNSIDSLVAWLASNKLGAIWVPINTAYKGAFLSHPIREADAAIVISEDHYVPRVAAIADDIPAVRLVLVRGEFGAATPGRPAFEPLNAHRGHDDAPLDTAVSPRDPSLLIFTGGTTGPSKACTISHNQIYAGARRVAVQDGSGPSLVRYSALPMFHLNIVAFTILSSAFYGGMAAVGQRFSVSNFWPEIERTGARVATLLGAMPAMIAMAPDCDAMKRCFGQLEQVHGAPFPPNIQNIFRTRFGVSSAGSNVYGMTEANSITSLEPGLPSKPGSSGKPNDWFEMLIVDDDDRPCPPGVPGEVIVRPRKPDIMFQGYWRRPVETLAVMRDLWFRTGDIGMLDEDDYFFFVDRKKDYLRRRGENISSFEMEKIFSQHPAIAEVAVHAVLSELGEDDLKVTCVLHQGAELKEEDLCRWSVDHVPYFAVPRYIEFRKELPRNAVGRVLKYELRNEGRTPATWDQEESDFRFERR